MNKTYDWHYLLGLELGPAGARWGIFTLLSLFFFFFSLQAWYSGVAIGLRLGLHVTPHLVVCSYTLYSLSPSLYTRRPTEWRTLVAGATGQVGTVYAIPIIACWFPMWLPMPEQIYIVRPLPTYNIAYNIGALNSRRARLAVHYRSTWVKMTQSTRD